MNDKIAFIVYRYNIENSPSIINAVKNLAENGFAVDIFIDKLRIEPNFKLDVNNVRLINFEQVKNPDVSGFSNRRSAGTLKRIKKLSGDGLYDNASKVLRTLFRLVIKESAAGIELSAPSKIIFRIIYPGLHSFTETLKEYVKNGGYKVCFTVEPASLVALWLAAGTAGIRRAIYWNMELDAVKDKNLKEIVSALSDKYLFNIIQDKARADVFVRNYRISRRKFYFVPVSYRNGTVSEKSDYLREKFAIPEDKKIVLYAGSVEKWAKCEELSLAAGAWPEKFVLVIHGQKRDKRYFEKVRRNSSEKKVILSVGYLDEGEFIRMVSSADIGVALYENDGYNFSLIGNASGKIGVYLMCGLPVITSNLPGLKETVEQYESGICVDAAIEIAFQLEKIAAGYEYFRNNAFRCYRERFCFDEYFAGVLAAVRSIPND